MLSMFKEANGQCSMRRVLAFIFALCSIALFTFAFSFSVNGWFVFLPGIACLVAVIILLFFTTWADVSEIVKAVKG